MRQASPPGGIWGGPGLQTRPEAVATAVAGTGCAGSRQKHSNKYMTLQEEITRRRTFAVIAHPDAGKTTLTEKLLLFGGALLVISLILLGNTIRLAIFSKRYLINTMKLVGATKWFIMRPFLGSSLTQGILAGTAASALFGLAVYGLNEAVPELMTIAEAGKIAIILGSMIAGGIIISGLFTFAALNKFINMKSNKIYLY